MIGEPKKDGVYISVELPEGYELKPGDRITFTTTHQDADLPTMNDVVTRDLTRDATRAGGFYWVKIRYDSEGDAWELAKWDDGWELISSPDGYWSGLLDKIVEVDERRIERTGEHK